MNFLFCFFFLYIISNKKKSNIDFQNDVRFLYYFSISDFFFSFINRKTKIYLFLPLLYLEDFLLLFIIVACGCFSDVKINFAKHYFYFIIRCFVTRSSVKMNFILDI